MMRAMAAFQSMPQNPKTLFFDIETVPASKEHHPFLREDYKNRLAKGKKVASSFEEFVSRTAFRGEFGRIVCLAYAIDDQPAEVLWGEEKEILAGFWKIAAADMRFVGHNIYEFDFPFIVARSRILGVKPSVMPSFVRYRSFPIYDTMKEWSLWANENVALHTLAAAFNLPTSKDDMDGSQVGAYFAAGRIEEICTYCKKDVDLTRQVYQRMTFDDSLPASINYSS